MLGSLLMKKKQNIFRKTRNKSITLYISYSKEIVVFPFLNSFFLVRMDV